MKSPGLYSQMNFYEYFMSENDFLDLNSGYRLLAGPDSSVDSFSRQKYSNQFTRVAFCALLSWQTSNYWTLLGAGRGTSARLVDGVRCQGRKVRIGSAGSWVWVCVVCGCGEGVDWGLAWGYREKSVGFTLGSSQQEAWWACLLHENFWLVTIYMVYHIIMRYIL